MPRMTLHLTRMRRARASGFFFLVILRGAKRSRRIEATFPIHRRMDCATTRAMTAGISPSPACGRGREKKAQFPRLPHNNALAPLAE
jgi:hypothetical protein